MDHKPMKAALAALVAAMALTSCTYATEAPEGRYAYTDLASHLQMCEEFTSELERPVCREAAYATWTD